MKGKISTDIKELVMARIDTMPYNRSIVIGNYGVFNKEQLKEHVENEDKIGIKVVEMQLEFLKALKDGRIYKAIDISNKA
ncbi:MAG: hypothetical protein QXD11_02905 [Candidatus Micrarchaeaceae archaeon]